MKTNPSILVLAISLFALAGCSSGGDAAAATPEQKKAFAGGPPPADYMSKVNAGSQKARAAAQAAAQNAPKSP